MLLMCRWVGAVGYFLLGVVGAGVIPLLYPAVKWYMVVVCFLSAPVFSVRSAPSFQLFRVSSRVSHHRAAVHICRGLLCLGACHEWSLCLLMQAHQNVVRHVGCECLVSSVRPGH